MIIQSCTFTVYFPPNTNIREQIFKLESHFEDFQKPFTLIPVPPDAPIELPRIIATSKYGHSCLTICGNSVQLVTNFDSEYNQDVQKCIGYVRSKCHSIVSALLIINGNAYENECPKFYFSGLSMNISMDESDGLKNPTRYIVEKFLRCTTNLPTDEIQFRFALTVEEKYYVNIMVQNSHLFMGRPDERGSLADLKEEKEVLQVVLDVNDRFAFNHIRNYVSTGEEVNRIARLMEEFTTKYVTKFIQKGEIVYDEQ